VLNFAPEKLLLVAVIALVVLGPQRLPGAARSLGKLMAELRRLSQGVQSEMRDALSEPHDALRNTVSDLGLNDLRQSFRDIVTPDAAPATRAPGAGPAASLPASMPPPPDDPSLN
jgi:sec-independent protein translocase protein TatB